MTINDVVFPWLRERLRIFERQEGLDDDSFASLHRAFLQSYFHPRGDFLVTPRRRTAVSRRSSSDLSTNSFHDYAVSVVVADLDGDTPILIWELRRGECRTKILDYSEWAESHLDWKKFLRVEELPTVHVVRVEKDKVRTFLVRDGWLEDQVEYSSLLDEGLSAWLGELVAKREHIT